MASPDRLSRARSVRPDAASTAAAPGSVAPGPRATSLGGLRLGPRVAEVCEGRDNNFNLLRMIAAQAVLWSHAYPIALGAGTIEPLKLSVGFTLGSLAVYVFFVISGFLIARSWDRRPRTADWIASRVMRLFPALIVVVLLTVLVLGPLVTVLPLPAYFSDPATWSYLLRNMTLASLQYNLPGVFVGQPAGQVINGSLWTLFYELVCYAGVLVAGLLALQRRPIWFAIAAAGCLAVYAQGAAAADAIHPKLAALRALALPFLLGMAVYVWRAWLPLGWGIAAALILLAAALRGTPVYELAVLIALAYATFVLAWRIGGVVRLYNRIGDYSYGTYLYAFPLQQLAMYGFAPMTPEQNVAWALPATLACAVLSWHLVEKPALDLRHRVADRLAGLGWRAPRRAR